MGNSLRCCLACVLPCGALDLIRIVHLDGYVEEITRPVTARQILQANPNHILSKPCSQGLVRKILILSPDSELKRGSIYFLLPDSSLPERKKSPGGAFRSSNNQKQAVSKLQATKCVEDDVHHIRVGHHQLSYCDRYLEDVIISEKKSAGGRDHRHRRRHSRSRSVSVWQPHLASISEDS